MVGHPTPNSPVSESWLFPKKESKMATTAEQRKRLALAGMVRVDGLTANHPDGHTSQIEVRRGEAGAWARNNGKFVINTLDGEVWLGDDHCPETARQQWKLSQELCLAGGAWVPCSNGDYIFTNHLLRRLANPDWMP
jgi:hypothetical protein